MFATSSSSMTKFVSVCLVHAHSICLPLIFAFSAGVDKDRITEAKVRVLSGNGKVRGASAS